MGWGNSFDETPEQELAGVATHIPLSKIYCNTPIKEYNNKVPTHDPYSNPDAHIYYQCACGQILDPGTRSFAALNNHASLVGWKVRWGASHYMAHCVECGKDVE